MKHFQSQVRGAFWGVGLQLTIYCAAVMASGSNGTNAIGATGRVQAGVRSITLPHFEPELPPAPGRDEYLSVCVSCHSARYVLMQPLFPQRQWEETVDKMTKVYGAQMDQGQRSAIVQYLVATHGPESTRAPGSEDDSDFVSVAKPGPQAETGPLLALATDGDERAQQVEQGAELFQKDCAGCHGSTGRGDGFIAEVLLRKPKDLAATRYSVRRLSQVLWNGKRGTAMPSWRGLPQADLGALAAYVQSLHPPAKADEISPVSLQRGNQVFLQNCAPCHGASGDGQGTAAAALLPEPANFQSKQPDADYILQVLSEGIPGTGMPAWNNQISESDRRALAGFVRSLFIPAD